MRTRPPPLPHANSFFSWGGGGVGGGSGDYKPGLKVTCFSSSAGVTLMEKGTRSSWLEDHLQESKENLSLLFIWMVLYIYLFLALAYSITAPLAVNILSYLCFWKKSRSVYKVCRYFIFPVCRQKSFLIWCRKLGQNKRNKDYFRYCCIFRKKKVFLLKHNYFCLQVLFVIYL